MVARRWPTNTHAAQINEVGGDSLTGRGSALPKICRPKYPTPEREMALAYHKLRYRRCEVAANQSTNERLKLLSFHICTFNRFIFSAYACDITSWHSVHLQLNMKYFARFIYCKLYVSMVNKKSNCSTGRDIVIYRTVVADNTTCVSNRVRHRSMFLGVSL
jgi:hypothetical protein